MKPIVIIDDTTSDFNEDETDTVSSDDLPEMHQCLENLQDSTIDYLNGDPDMPIYLSDLCEPVETLSVVEIIKLKTLDSAQVAKLNPGICDQNATFIVDVSNLKHQIITNFASTYMYVC